MRLSALFLVATPLLMPLAAFAAPGEVQGAAQEQPLPVTFATVEQQALSSERVLTGTVEAAETVPAGFETGGRIISLNVKAGDQLATGDVIATLDSTQQEAAKRSATASLSGAETALQQAQDDFDRQTQLLKKGVVTKARAEEAERALVVARSAVDNARTQLSKAETALNQTVLKAESDSIVTETNVEVGQIVGAGQAVVSLASRSGRDAVFLVPDGAHPEQFLGQSVTISSLDTPGSELGATLSEVSPMVDQRTGSIRVKARLEPGAAADLSIGEVIEGRVKFNEGTALVVPWNALTSTDTGIAVWVVDPQTSRVVLRPIKVQRYTTEKTVISEGLSPGDVVVAAGSQLLYPDRPVVNAAEVSQP